MKRALVAYSSEEEDERPQPKRKLPPLSSSLTVPTPVDNPAFHQGRVRAVPHVEGQYAAYIYVPLVLHPRDALYKLAGGALTLAQAQVPSLHAIGQQGHAARWELHISLSRPLFLRAHQREEFKRAIQRATSSTAPFDASFTTFLELTNDERTRTFLALEVGAGHGELCRTLDLLGPTLRLLRQKEFYDDPKFHASIAWALLEKTLSSPDTLSPSEPEVIEVSNCAAPEEHARSTSVEAMAQPSNSFHRIPHFPRTLVPALNEAYAAKLSQARIGSFVIDRIAVKIGKDVFTWSLSGMR